jgi:hypothetical protein
MASSDIVMPHIHMDQFYTAVHHLYKIREGIMVNDCVLPTDTEMEDIIMDIQATRTEEGSGILIQLAPNGATASYTVLNVGLCGIPRRIR